MTAASPAATVTLVAAVARNGVIGRDGEIPWHLPGEQATFKALTMGHVLLMGRLTYDSIGRPLPGRTTVVVSRQPDWQPPGGADPRVFVEHDIESALQRARLLGDRVFVVGGGQVYRETMANADRLVITWVDQEPAGDAVFPEVDADVWQEVDRKPADGWTVVDYVRRVRPPGDPENSTAERETWRFL